MRYIYFEVFQEKIDGDWVSSFLNEKVVFCIPNQLLNSKSTDSGRGGIYFHNKSKENIFESRLCKYCIDMEKYKNQHFTINSVIDRIKIKNRKLNIDNIINN